VNSGAVTTSELIVNPAQDLFSVTLGFPALAAGDNLHYRIRAVDSVGNTAVYPPSDFMHVAALSMASPVDQFVTDFTSSADVSGNFFSVDTKDGFQNAALHSPHPYLERIGPDPASSTYTCVVRKPIKISATNPFISFDEVVLTQYTATEAVDYVVVEGSKDGVTWEKIVSEHASNFDAKWKAAYNTGSSGASSLFVNRIVSLTASGKFATGDVILIRFRLRTNDAESGWGFAIDNLSIQGIVTGVASSSEAFSIYPNPATGNEVSVRISAGKNNSVGIRLLNAQGTIMRVHEFPAEDDVVDHSVDIGDLPDGLYLISVATRNGTSVGKFIKGR
jgi:hypothetical protein